MPVLLEKFSLLHHTVENRRRKFSSVTLLSKLNCEQTACQILEMFKILA